MTYYRIARDFGLGQLTRLFSQSRPHRQALDCVCLMPKITAIEVQKRDPNRVNIHLDGEYAFGLARITAAWLKVGLEIDQQKMENLQADDARERAYQQALLYLSYRARSEEEIRKNLRKHEVPEAIIEETLKRLRANRLADDGQFAQIWVENRSTFRPRSRRALTIELKQKGLEEPAIRSALEAVDDEAMAYEAAFKRIRKLEGKEWSDFRKKLSEFLARRGFSYSVIAPVVTKVWNETHSQEKYFEDEDTA